MGDLNVRANIDGTVATGGAGLTHIDASSTNPTGQLVDCAAELGFSSPTFVRPDGLEALRALKNTPGVNRIFVETDPTDLGDRLKQWATQPRQQFNTEQPMPTLK